MTVELKHLNLDNFSCQSGKEHSLRLAYRTYGTLNSSGSNAIVIPTYYTGTDLSYMKVVGEDCALNPDKYFIIIPNLFGNGVSSSPSNMPPPYDKCRFPKLTMYDNVKAQKLLIDHLGVKSIALVLGWSMGGVQSYQWAAQYPMVVKRAMVICGAAKTAEHNKIFLKGVKAALEADEVFSGGDYTSKPRLFLKHFIVIIVI